MRWKKRRRRRTSLRDVTLKDPQSVRLLIGKRLEWRENWTHETVQRLNFKLECWINTCKHYMIPSLLPPFCDKRKPTTYYFPVSWELFCSSQERTSLTATLVSEETAAARPSNNIGFCSPTWGPQVGRKPSGKEREELLCLELIHVLSHH